MANGLVGKVAGHEVTAFLLFMVLVWVSVAVGKLLVGLLPIPHPAAVIMDASGQNRGYGSGEQPLVEQR